MSEEKKNIDMAFDIALVKTKNNKIIEVLEDVYNKNWEELEFLDKHNFKREMEWVRRKVDIIEILKRQIKDIHESSNSEQMQHGLNYLKKRLLDS